MFPGPHANRASRLSVMTPRQNSGALRGPGKLTYRNSHIQPAHPCSEIWERRKEFTNFPTNCCQCFCVTDAPEIYHSPGLVVVREFLTAIQASDVGSSAIDRPASWQVGRDRLAHCYRRALVPMGAGINQADQCPEKKRDTEDHIPP